MKLITAVALAAVCTVFLAAADADDLADARATLDVAEAALYAALAAYEPARDADPTFAAYEAAEAAKANYKAAYANYMAALADYNAAEADYKAATAEVGD